MHCRQSFPVLAAVVSAENVAGTLILNAPGGNENGLGVVGIDRDVIEHVIVATSQFGKPRPAMPTVLGDENHARAGTQENTVRLMRIISQTANVASIRTQNGPLMRASASHTGRS